MNRYRHAPSFLLFLLTLIFGQAELFAQYYPPAVSVTGFDSSPVMLYGGGGQYSGSYMFTYSYDTTVENGYWDYTTNGHWETQDQGYWDTSPGHYEDQGYWDNTAGYTDSDGSWVSQPSWVSNYVWVTDPATWISNPVSVYIYDPTWVNTGSTTNTVTGTATATLGVYIDSAGYTSVSYTDSLNSNTYYSYDYYDFQAGSFTGGVSITAVNTDASSWSPPPPPPTCASFGPAAIWVEGQCYTWAYTEFSDSAMTAGTDYYAYGSGPQVWFRSGNGSSSNEVGGYTSSSRYWTGTATNGVFENTGGVDVRSADLSGGFVQGTAPDGLPPAVRVDGSAILWRFIGQGASLYHYAGDDNNERLTIDASTGIVSMLDDGSSALYKNGVVWTSNGSRGIRAASLDGSLWQNNDQSPSWGPPDVYVRGTIWRYVGTWDGTASFSGTPPLTGDHYLGENARQRLVVDASGNVTVFNGAGISISGTYAPQGQLPGEPRVFTVSGYEVFPGDENGVYSNTQPAIGPPAIRVNDTLYTFASSNEDAGSLGTWVDTYMDGDNNFLLVGANEVRSFRRSGTGFTSDWSGYYIPADTSPHDGGIFVVVNGSPRYDVRAVADGGSLLPPVWSPLNGHPVVVKVDGGVWNFAGSSTDTDYYFGANPGKRLWIDAAGVVSFTNNVNSPNLAGSGHFVGSIFLVEGHDVRACTSDIMPVAAVGSPQYGPASLWVEGVIWSFIGSVSNDDLQVHADFYGGANAGQIIRLNSDMSVSGAYTGVFDAGVFVVDRGGDVRALDSNGVQIPAIGHPAVDGRPGTLRIGGLHWIFVGTSGGVDYYASALGGQRLSIDANGTVYYSDRPHLVNNASGTFAGGVFTSTGGGLSFNAGTIGNDLDILGNNLSFGSLMGNSQTAGVTMQFSDNGTIASLQNSLARPQARWGWNRLSSEGAATGLPVMQLDTQGRLNLYDPETASTPQIEPTISLAPGIEGGVQVSRLPKLELSQQGLESDNSVLTKGLADSRYIISAGDGQSLSTLSVTGSASLANAVVSGSLTVANSQVITQSTGDERYLKVSASAPVVIANGATIAGATQVNGALNTNGDLTSSANADFKGNVVVESNFTVRGAFDGPPEDRKVIMQSGKKLLIPESGDVSMGAYRFGPLPEAVASP